MQISPHRDTRASPSPQYATKTCRRTTARSPPPNTSLTTRPLLLHPHRPPPPTHPQRARSARAQRNALSSLANVHRRPPPRREAVRCSSSRVALSAEGAQRMEGRRREGEGVPPSPPPLSRPASDLLEHKVEDGLDHVRAALDDGDLHRRSIRHRRVVHTQPLDGRVEQVEALLVDERGDGRADAARVGGLVEDGNLRDGSEKAPRGGLREWAGACEGQPPCACARASRGWSPCRAA